MVFRIVLLGAGIILTGVAGSVPSLIAATLVMSFGFHFFGPSSNRVILMTVYEKEAPRSLGILQSFGAGAALLATVIVYFLTGRIGYSALFFLVGGLILLPFGRGGHSLPLRRRAKLRRRYLVFYSLAFLMGSRRHIFTTFAPFLLVKEHGVSVQMMAILFFINALINTYAYQFVGKIAVSAEELTGNLSAQTTINHISAVVVSVLGGTIWALFGPKAPFLAGVGIAVVSLGLVQFVLPGQGQTSP